MSFFSKIVENKGVAIAVTAGVLGVGAVAWLYNNFKSQENGEENAIDGVFDLDKEIENFKKTVNTENPSLDDIKAILTFAVDVSKRKILTYSKQFKRRRREFSGDKKKQRISQYMNLLANGMEEVQNLGVTQQQQILAKLGVEERMFVKYQRELGMFMQQLMMNQQINSDAKPMTLQEVKKCIRLQINYVKESGEQMVLLIVEATKSWPQQKKALLPYLISIIIGDGAFEDRPDIDQEALQAEEMKFQQYLAAQLQELQRTMTPLMMKLSGGMGGGMGMGGGGMDMGGMDMGGMDMGGMDMGGMGGMDMGGITPQQLQQLQMQDPAAFEQLMGMMYQQG